MRSSAMASLAAFFFAMYTAAPVAGQTSSSGINCERSDLAGFESMHSPAEGFLIYWNHPTDSISFRVEVVSEEWAAVGFSEDGMMIGSDAVIFLPEEDDVSEHILGSKSVSDILPSDITELSDTSFEQDGTKTIFKFTRNTTPEDTESDKLVIPNIPNQPIYIIWSKGMDNGFGYHGADNRGSFLVDLFCTELITPAPTAPATLAPVAVVQPPPPTAAPVTPESPPSFTLPPGGAAETAPPGAAAAPTAEPVAAATTGAPVAAPTGAPVAPPTAAPVAPPTAAAVVPPTAAPVAVAAPTAEPVAALTSMPIVAPTSRDLPIAEPVMTTAPVAEASPVVEEAPTSRDLPIAEPVMTTAPVAEESPIAEDAPTAEGETTTAPAAAPSAEVEPTAETHTTTAPAVAPSSSDSTATRSPVEGDTESPAAVIEDEADPSAPTAEGETPSPSAGSGEAAGGEGTGEPSPSATGYVGGAASLGRGAEGTAVASAVLAGLAAVVWARWN